MAARRLRTEPRATPTPIFIFGDGSLVRGSMPDFSDPRRLKRALLVLDKCYELDLAASGRRRIPAQQLRKIFGNASNSALAKFMHTLIAQRGFYSTNGECYEYQTVPHRVARLERLIRRDKGFVQFAGTKGKSFATAPALSDYKRTGDRHYAWWTSMRKEFRQKLFLQTHGRMFDYDLEAAKPMLTLQGFEQLMVKHHPIQFKSNPDFRLPTWTKLVGNRTAFRAELALQVGISVEEAKQVCQNVLNSSWASTNSKNGVCKLIGKSATERLIKCDMYQGLRKDFRVMWSQLKTQKRVKGQTAGQFMSAYYNSLELQVMGVIAEHIEADAWFIHDGFMTHEPVNMDVLIGQVKAKTGFDVKVECKFFELQKDGMRNLRAASEQGTKFETELDNKEETTREGETREHMCDQEGPLPRPLNVVHFLHRENSAASTSTTPSSAHRISASGCSLWPPQKKPSNRQAALNSETGSDLQLLTNG